MISAISVISALITFVYLIVLAISDLPNLVQIENKGIITLHVANFMLSFLIPMTLIAFGIMF